MHVDSAEYKRAREGEARLKEHRTRCASRSDMAKIHKADPFVYPRIHGRAGNRRFLTGPAVALK